MPRPVRPPLCQVFLALCTAALHQDQLTDAERLLAQAREADPGHTDLPLLGLELARRKHGARELLERELRRTQAQAPAAQTEAAARELLARFPDSAVAGRILREILDQRAAQAATDLLSHAKAARHDGALHKAVALLQEALPTLATLSGPAHTDLRAGVTGLLQQTEAELRSQRDAALVEHTRAALLASHPPDEDAVLRYAALDRDLRERVRAACDLPHLRWLEELAAHGAVSTPQARAVLALDRALSLEGTPQAALDLLAQHERVLSRLPDFSAAAAHLQGALAQHLQRQGLAALAAVTEAANQDPGQAQLHLRRLREIDLRLLPEQARVHAEVLAVGLQVHVDRVRLQNKAGDLIRRKRASAARDTIDELLSLLARWGQDRPAVRPLVEYWQDKRRKLDVIIDREVAWAVSSTPGPKDELRDMVLNPRSQRLLLPGGDEVLLARDAGPVVLVRILDVNRRVVTRRASFIVVPMLELEAAVITAAGAWLLGKQGALLIDLVELRVLRRHLADDLLDHGRRLLGGTASPDGEALWLDVDVGGVRGLRGAAQGLHPKRVLDARSPAARRNLGPRGQSCALLGPAAPAAMACVKPAGPLVLCSAAGAPVREYDLPPGTDVGAVVAGPGPGGPELLALYGQRCDPSQPVRKAFERPLRWAGLYPGGAVSQEQLLQRWQGFGISAATLPTAAGRRTFVRTRVLDLPHGEPEEAELLVLGPALDPEQQAGGLPALLHVTPLPPRTLMLVDPESTHGVLLAVLPSGETLAGRLTAAGAPPEIERASSVRGQVRERPVPDYAGDCSLNLHLDQLPKDPRPKGKNSPSAELAERDVEVLKHLKDFRTGGQGPLGDMVRLVERMDKLAHSGKLDRSGAPLTAGAQEAAAGVTPLGKLIHVGQFLSTQNYKQALEVLRDVRPSDLMPQHVQHLHHTRCVAQAWLGAIDEARAELALAQAAGGLCDLTALEVALEPLPEPPLPPDWSAGQPTERVLMALVREADELLAQDDPAAVVALLDQGLVWAAQDIQAVARLAQAWLHLGLQGDGPLHDEVGATRRLLALGNMMYAFNHRSEQPSLLHPGRSWDAGRLHELAKACWEALQIAWALRNGPPPWASMVTEA